jgi:hypothetical protein
MKNGLQIGVEGIENLPTQVLGIFFWINTNLKKATDESFFFIWELATQITIQRTSYET